MSRVTSPAVMFASVATAQGDLGVSWVSSGQDLQNVDNYSVQVVYPAAWNGVFTLEGSDNSTTGLDGSWNTYPVDATPAFPASDAGAGSFVVRCTNLCTRWLRMRFVRTSGSGLITTPQCGKGTG